MHILVTGGAGFIGSNFVHHMLGKYSDYHITVIDKMTYAGNLDNLKQVMNDPRFRFVKGDICDAVLVEQLASEVDAIVNFAAETHVDRSLMEPGSFIQTDVHGAYVLAEAARKVGVKRIIQISTDEVYGSVETGSSKETDILKPSSPYSASKAGGEMVMMAYFTTYGLPVMITRGSNNFGPYQYPEKVVPLFITNAIEDQQLPLYGDGLNIRDWIYVLDHCTAIDLVLHEGKPGEIYNVGGGNERTNIDITNGILTTLGKPKSLIKRVADRPGHDRRYSLDCTKLKSMGWRPRQSFEQDLEQTVRWYVDNAWWWRKLKSGEYQEYYRANYANRTFK